MLTKTDFLGNEYKPGDFVVYAQVSDRCANMIKAQVTEILEDGKVKVQPLAGSRWRGHRNRTYTVDTRTGKRIDPWKGNGKHIKEPSYYVDECGTKYSMEEYRNLHWEDRVSRKFHYVATVFHDYVGTRTEPVKSVTLTVTENIVKFADGELPAEG